MELHPPPVPAPPPSPRPQSRLRQLLAPVLAAAVALGKYGAVLLKIKGLVLLGSMAASIWAYATLFGWRFAVGFVLLIAVHELGHVVALRARGIEAGLPVFLPFLGAFVSMTSPPRSAYEEAESALAGPVAGTAASFLVAYAAHAGGSGLLRSLALTGFLINLFNLLPALPLDGGRTVGALNPKIWFLGLLALLGYELWHPSPVVPIVLVLGAFELYRRWKGRDTPASRQYFALSRDQRLRIGTAYVALVVVLVWAVHSNQLPAV